MKKIAFVIFMISVALRGNAQCPDFYVEDSVIDCNCKRSFCHNIKKNIRNNSLDVVGGYLHDIDSIKIFSGNNCLFKGKIDNRQPEVDGPSFVANDLKVVNSDGYIRIELDTCSYLLELDGIGKIVVTRMTPDISVKAYCMEENCN